MNVAFLIDASQRVGNDEFKEVKTIITSVLDYLHIAPDPLTSSLGDQGLSWAYLLQAMCPTLGNVLSTWNLIWLLRTVSAKWNIISKTILSSSGEMFISVMPCSGQLTCLCGNLQPEEKQSYLCHICCRDQPLRQESLKKCFSESQVSGLCHICVFFPLALHTMTRMRGISQPPTESALSPAWPDPQARSELYHQVCQAICPFNQM